MNFNNLTDSSGTLRSQALEAICDPSSRILDLSMPVSPCSGGGGSPTGPIPATQVLYSNVSYPTMNSVQTALDYLLSTTYNNGLTKNTTTNVVQLGGPLLHDTLIDQGYNEMKFKVQDFFNAGFYYQMINGAFGAEMSYSGPSLYRSVLTNQGGSILFSAAASNAANTTTVSVSHTSARPILFTDSVNNLGAFYQADYSALGAAASALWIPHKGYNDARYALATTSTAYIQNQTASLQAAAFKINTGWFQGGAEALKVGTKPGGPNYAFMGFYALQANSAVRCGSIGYLTDSSTTLELSNEIIGSPLTISTNGASGHMFFRTNLVTGLYINGLTQNILMQSGGLYTDNGVDRLQVKGSGLFWGGGEALKVGTGTGLADNAFIGLYARNGTPTVRSGLVGYNTAGGSDLTISNSLAGNIFVSTGGSNQRVQVDATTLRIVPHAADTVQNALLLAQTSIANFEIQTSTANGATFRGVGYVGSISAKTAIVSGTVLCRLLGSGFENGGTVQDSAIIRSLGTETWVPTTNRGSKWEFYTTANASITQTLRLTIDQDGSLVHAGNRTGTPVNLLAVSSAGKLINWDGSLLITALNFQNATSTLVGNGIDFNLAGSRYQTISADTTYSMSNTAEGKGVDLMITALGADRTITISGVIWKGNPSLIITSGNTAWIYLKMINGTVWGTFAQ